MLRATIKNVIIFWLFVVSVAGCKTAYADHVELANIYALSGVDDLVSSRAYERIVQSDSNGLYQIIRSSVISAADDFRKDRASLIADRNFSELSKDGRERFKTILNVRLKERLKEWVPSAARSLLYDDLFCSAISQNEDLKEIVSLEKSVEAALDTTIAAKGEQIADIILNDLGSTSNMGELLDEFENGSNAKLLLGAVALPLSAAFGSAAVNGVRSRIDSVLSDQLPPEALYYLKLGPEKFASFAASVRDNLPAQKFDEAIASVRSAILNKPLVVLPTGAYVAILSGSAAAHFSKGFATCPMSCNWYEIDRGREVTKVLLWQARNKSGVALDVGDFISIARAFADRFGINNIAAVAKMRSDISKLTGRFDKISEMLGKIDKFANDKLGNMQTALNSASASLQRELLEVQSDLVEPIKEAAKRIDGKLDLNFPDLGIDAELIDEIGKINPLNEIKSAVKDSELYADLADDLAKLNDKLATEASDIVATLVSGAGLVNSEAVISPDEDVPAQNESVSSDFDPVRLHNGEFTIERTDLGSVCDGLCLTFKRTYRSHAAIRGPLGFGWTHNFAERLLFSDGGVVWLDGEGKKFLFKEATGDLFESDIDGKKIVSAYVSPAGVFAKLFIVRSRDQVFYAMFDRSNLRTIFDSEGRLLSKVDGQGKFIRILYENGSPVEVRDADGYKLRFAYDRSGHLVRVADSLGRRVDFGFDALGDLSTAGVRSSKRARVRAFSYSYKDHKLTQIRDPKGEPYLQNVYGEDGASRGRVVKQLFGDRAAIYASYENVGIEGDGGVSVVAQRAFVTDRNGTLWIYEHNANGNLINEWYLAKDGRVSPVAFRRFDDDGNVVWKIYPDGRYTRYFYVGGSEIERGNLLSVKECAGGDLKNWRFDDSNCRSVNFEYSDALGVPIAVQNAFGRVEFAPSRDVHEATSKRDVEFDANGNVSRQIVDGAKSNFSYDILDLLSEAETLTPNGRLKFKNEYDALGNLRSVRSNDEIDIFERDEFGRVIRARHGGGGLFAEETFRYDLGGRIVQYVDAYGAITNYSYNGFGELIEMTRGDARFVYERDAIGRITSKTCVDALSGEISCRSHFEYDGAGQKIKKIVSDYWTNDPANFLSIASDEIADHDLAADMSSNDGVHSKANDTPTLNENVIERDAVGRIVKLVDLNGHATTFAYDWHQLPIVERLANGAERRFYYDELGRLTGIKKFGGEFISIEYDALGRIASQSIVVGTQKIELQSYNYDAFGRLISSVDRNDPARDDDNVMNFYLRDSLGGIWGEYNGWSWIVSSRDFANEGLNVRYPSGRVVKRGGEPNFAPDEPDRRLITDELGRLVRDEFEEGFESWILDGVANFITKESARGKETFEIDEVNAYRQMTSSDGNAKEFSYDADGNLTSDGEHIFEFDHLGRLAKVRSVSGELLGEYLYDVQNRRVKKSVSGETKKYSYFGFDLFRVENDANRFAEFAFADGIDQPVAIFSNEQKANLIVRLDRFNNVKIIEDASGELLLKRDFGPYGELRKIEEKGELPKLAKLFGFAAREEDEESGLYYFRNRYFSPKLGRFISFDPIGAAGGVNRYAFVGGRVTSYGDPLGLFALKYHEDFTVAALGSFGLLNVKNAALLGNFGADFASVSGLYRPLGYSKNEHISAQSRHFDNLSDARAIKDVWGELLGEIGTLNRSPAVTTPAEARNLAMQLGGILHQAQDFYSHSNWVEFWNDQGKYGADIPTFLDAVPNDDAKLFTGAWGNGSNPKCPKSHEQLSKDNPDRAGFDQAALAATRASSEILALVSRDKISALASADISSPADALNLANMRNLAALAKNYY